jgi:hypothetical protein
VLHKFTPYAPETNLCWCVIAGYDIPRSLPYSSQLFFRSELYTPSCSRLLLHFGFPGKYFLYWDTSAETHMVSSPDWFQPSQDNGLPGKGGDQGEWQASCHKFSDHTQSSDWQFDLLDYYNATTKNSNSSTNLRTLQFTTAHTNSSQSLAPSSVGCLVTASNSADSSATDCLTAPHGVNPWQLSAT